MTGPINFHKRVVFPIRDMVNNGKIVFEVIVYGYTRREAMIIPGGSAPALAAIKRMGLDPNRYQAVIWDQ